MATHEMVLTLPTSQDGISHMEKRLRKAEAQRDALMYALAWMVQRADEGSHPYGRCLATARATLKEMQGDEETLPNDQTHSALQRH